MTTHLHRGWALRLRRMLSGLPCVCLLGALLWAWPAPTRAATEIAILNSSDIAAYREAISGFKAKGPGNAIYNEYDLQGDLETGKRIARKIRASDTALVLAIGLKAALAAKSEIADIPVVYMMVLDPARHRLSGPNMTGTLLEVPLDRQLKTIRTFLPNVRRLGTLYDPKKSAARIRDVEHQISTYGLGISTLPVESEKDVPQRLRDLLPTADALWLLPDSTVLTNDSVQFILESALAQHMPVIGFSSEFARLGALLTLSVSYVEIGHQTGLLARQILNGDRSLPVTPVAIDRVKISVNLKTARFLGLNFPKELEGMIDETF
jgi:putative ABC transport system substrate-binding protein